MVHQHVLYSISYWSGTFIHFRGRFNGGSRYLIKDPHVYEDPFIKLSQPQLGFQWRHWCTQRRLHRYSRLIRALVYLIVARLIWIYLRAYQLSSQGEMRTCRAKVFRWGKSCPTRFRYKHHPASSPDLRYMTPWYATPSYPRQGPYHRLLCLMWNGRITPVCAWWFVWTKRFDYPFNFVWRQDCLLRKRCFDYCMTDCPLF